MEVLRRSSCPHWDLGGLFGGHCASFQEAIDTAELVRVVKAEVLAELRELLVAGSWARHTTPPGGLVAMLRAP